MSIQKRKLALQYGHDSEQKADEYFLGLGYQTIAKNFRCRRGEIDLVIFRAGVLVFVEVKARHSTVQYHPAYAVVGEKRSRLLVTARLFLVKVPNLPKFDQIRFDLLVLTGSRVSEHREDILFL